MEINLKFSLCIALLYSIYFARGHGEVQDVQGNAEEYNDANEDINLDLLAGQGELVKSQFVVIMFCKAMNAELQKEGKPPTAEINKIIEQLYAFKPQDKHKDNLGLEEMEDLFRIFQFAKQALNYYKSYLFGEKRLYTARAHYYRLLLWLRIMLRSEPNNPNKFFESNIDEILEPRDDDTQPRNLEVELYPNTIRQLQNECLQIRTLYDLKNRRFATDDIILLFFQLVQYDGDISKVDSQLTYLIPTRGEHVNRRHCAKSRKNLETVLATLSYDYDKFQNEFRQTPEQILLYINEAIHVRCETGYKRVKVETINLKDLGDDTCIFHLRNAMILYNNAIEKKLLLGAEDENVLTTVLQLENFPIGFADSRELQTNTLLNLSLDVIKKYHQQILDLYDNQTRILDNSLEACYGRLIIWVYNQISRINSYQLHTYSVMVTLEAIWKNWKPVHLSYISLNTLRRDLYDEIATFDRLISFCETGNSNATIKQSENQGNGIAPEVEMEE